MEFFIAIIMVALAFSFALSLFFERIGIPVVVGQIAAGIVLGLPFIREFIVLNGGVSIIQLFSELGIIFLLLLTGLQIDFTVFRKSLREILLVGIFGALIPFIVGFMVMKFLGFSNLVSLVVGASLALTSEETKLGVLKKLKLAKTRIAGIMLGAGITDDIFEVIFLGLILFIAQRDIGGIVAFPFKVLAFTGLVYLIVKAIPKLANLINIERSEVSEFSLLIILVLFIASSSIIFGLGPIIGAFISGIIIQYAMNKKEEKKMVKDFRILAYSFIVPFFFINIGFNFDFMEVYKNLGLFVIIVVLAFVTKIGAALLVSSFSRINYRQGWVIGWAMNSRGAVELVIAEVARVTGLINITIYSIIVGMTIITTAVFPFVLKYYVKKYPGIMNK